MLWNRHKKAQEAKKKKNAPMGISANQRVFFDSKGNNHLGKMNKTQTGKTIRKQRMCQEINIQNIESTIQLINWLINLNNPFFFFGKHVSSTSKKSNITNHQRNANVNHPEIASPWCNTSYYLKRSKTTRVGEHII